MKKVQQAFLVGILSLLLTSVQAQENEAQTHRHEFGLDVTSLLGRIISPSVWGFTTIDYEPTYYLYYRYRWDRLRLRTALGGALSSNNLENNNRVNRDLDYKLGIEFFSSIGKRWELYYGLDGVMGMSERYNEYERYGEYLYYNEDKMNYFGAAPFLGFRFKLSPRMNIAVEMSVIIRREHIVYRQVYMRDLVENPVYDRPAEREDVYQQSNIFYTAPDFLVLNFLL